MGQRKALGRGLNALLGTADLETDQLREIDIDRILPNSNQPRKTFDEDALNELADSIREHGLVQPVVVRPLEDGFFQLIAGERRWRACQRVGLSRVPALVREAAENSALELALIENLQREDINPVEAALAYRRLRDEFGMSQDEIARRVGKSPSSVSNVLRLLALPPRILDSISHGEITEGHGRALLQVRPEAQHVAWDNIRKRGLSVREAEKMGREFRQTNQKRSHDIPGSPTIRTKDPNDLAIEEALRAALGTKVALHRLSHGVGKIEVHFYSEEQLEGLIQRFTGV